MEARAGAAARSGARPPPSRRTTPARGRDSPRRTIAPCPGAFGSRGWPSAARRLDWSRMPPKGSGARCRINVDKAERGGAVIFQVRLRAAGVPTVKGPPRENLAAAAADKACLLRVPETGRHAELRRLQAEHAQGTEEGPQTPRRQQGSPPRRRVTGKRGPSPRRSPAPRAAAGTPASGPRGGLRTPGASATGRRPQRTPETSSRRGLTPRTAGGAT